MPASDLNNLRKKAESGDGDAQYDLGFSYKIGDGAPKDYAEAFKWLYKAADRDNEWAQQDVGELYSAGQGVGQDVAEGYFWYALASTSPWSMEAVPAKIAQCLSEEQRAELDSRVLDWTPIRSPRIEGEPFAPLPERPQKRHAEGIEGALQPAPEETPDVASLQIKAGGGDAAAQKSLGDFYRSGRNFTEAARWFRLAAEQGVVGAQRELGGFYEGGRAGIEKNYAEAEKWYRKAADLGDAAARKYIGNLYAKGGPGLKQDFERAFSWYRDAAEHGDAYANILAGDLWRDGKGVPQNYAEALRWYQLAQERGDKWAPKKIGDLYAKGGPGLDQDYAAAMKCFCPIAEQGDASAQLSVGHLYNKGGPGIDRDQAEAFRWYRMAAQRQDSYGQWNLGNAYRYGEGVSQDNVEAFFWYALASCSRMSVLTVPAAVAKALTSRQKEEVYRFLRDWKPIRIIKVEGEEPGKRAPQLSQAGNTPYLASLRAKAGQGDADARKKLIELYADESPGAPQDLPEAYFWYCIAAGKGGAKDSAAFAARLGLNADQIAAVDKRVAEWKPGKG